MAQIHNGPHDAHLTVHDDAMSLEAAGTDDVMALEDKTFFARLDLNQPPPFEHEGGERLEWPELRLAPPMSEVYKALGIEPPKED